LVECQLDIPADKRSVVVVVRTIAVDVLAVIIDCYVRVFDKGYDGITRSVGFDEFTFISGECRALGQVDALK
jgi:hypothetical protein